MTIRQEHLGELREAKKLLESSSFAQQLIDMVGKPISIGIDQLPPEYAENISSLTQKTLEKLLQISLVGMDLEADDEPSPLKFKLMVAGAGGIGGAFGLPVLAVELPFSTGVMLRSIADIARSNGENLAEIETKLACLEVFAFTGDQEEGDQEEGDQEEGDPGSSSYYAVRMGLAVAVRQAVEFAAKPGINKLLARETPPILIQLVTRIAARFGVAVSQKVMAQMMPLIGGIGGAAINTIFIDHYQNMAEGHFAVRRLERVYGEKTIREAYQNIDISQEKKALMH